MMTTSVISILVGIYGLYGPVATFILEQDGWDYSRCPHHLPRDKYLFPFRDQCIQIVEQEVYWYTARDTCIARGGRLVEIYSQSKQSFIEWAVSREKYQDGCFWIGLSDNEVEHTFKWNSGSVLTSDSYSHWSPGEDSSGILHWVQDCVYINTGNHALWYDTTCDSWPNDYNFICEYDMLPLPTTTSRPTTTTTTTMTTTATTKSTTTTTSTATTDAPTTIQATTLPTTSTTTSCSLPDCQQQCPGGYSGVFAGADGCVTCICS